MVIAVAGRQQAVRKIDHTRWLDPQRLSFRNVALIHFAEMRRMNCDDCQKHWQMMREVIKSPVLYLCSIIVDLFVPGESGVKSKLSIGRIINESSISSITRKCSRIYRTFEVDVKTPPRQEDLLVELHSVTYVTNPVTSLVLTKMFMLNCEIRIALVVDKTEAREVVEALYNIFKESIERTHAKANVSLWWVLRDTWWHKWIDSFKQTIIHTLLMSFRNKLSSRRLGSTIAGTDPRGDVNPLFQADGLKVWWVCSTLKCITPIHAGSAEKRPETTLCL